MPPNARFRFIEFFLFLIYFSLFCVFLWSQIFKPLKRQFHTPLSPNNNYLTSALPPIVHATHCAIREPNHQSVSQSVSHCGSEYVSRSAKSLSLIVVVYRSRSNSRSVFPSSYSICQLVFLPLTLANQLVAIFQSHSFVSFDLFSILFYQFLVLRLLLLLLFIYFCKVLTLLPLSAFKVCFVLRNAQSSPTLIMSCGGAWCCCCGWQRCRLPAATENGIESLILYGQQLINSSTAVALLLQQRDDVSHEAVH